MKHAPITQGYDLINHEAVSESWAVFFERCMEVAANIRKIQSGHKPAVATENEAEQDLTTQEKRA